MYYMPEAKIALSILWQEVFTIKQITLKNYFIQVHKDKLDGNVLKTTQNIFPLCCFR